MEKFWITLFPDTFLWIKNEEGLIYNANDFTSLHFKYHECIRIKELCMELLVTENLYTARLTSTDMENSELKKWIYDIVDIRAGYLTSGLEKRPVSFIPMSKIFNNVEHYIWEHNRGTGGNMILNLHELTFYLNKTQWGNDEYFKQTIFPLKNCSTLEPDKVILFIRNSKNLFLSNINFVGDFFSYPHYRELIFDDIPITIHETIQDFTDKIQQINDNKWPDHIRFNIMIDSQCKLLLNDLHNTHLPISVSAIVTSEDNFEMFSELFESYSNFKDKKMIPVYDGENLDFFQSHVFIDQEELNTVALTKREIFMRQTLNISHFGKLTILADGSVYANVNKTPLGTVDDSPYSIVYKEFTEGETWFKIRNQSPCNSCINQWLCPSPSTYETVIGRPNLCHIIQ